MSLLDAAVNLVADYAKWAVIYSLPLIVLAWWLKAAVEEWTRDGGGGR